MTKIEKSLRSTLDTLNKRIKTQGVTYLGHELKLVYARTASDELGRGGVYIYAQTSINTAPLKLTREQLEKI